MIQSFVELYDAGALEACEILDTSLKEKYMRPVDLGPTMAA
jgi:hypothetical protein